MHSSTLSPAQPIINHVSNKMALHSGPSRAVSILGGDLGVSRDSYCEAEVAAVCSAAQLGHGTAWGMKK